MTLVCCNCGIDVQIKQGVAVRRYSLYISYGNDNEQEEMELNNLDIDDLRILEKELQKSIHLETITIV